MTNHAYSSLLIGLLFLFGCASNTKVLKPEYSLSEIKEAVEANLPGTLHGISTNGRVYKTKAFKLPPLYRKKVHTRKGPAPERAYGIIKVLGDLRPYELEVTVEVEELTGVVNGKPRYVIARRSKELEQDLINKIDQYLVKRFKNKDLIDGFRPF